MAKKESKVLVKDHMHPAAALVDENHTIKEAVDMLRQKPCMEKLFTSTS